MSKAKEPFMLKVTDGFIKPFLGKDVRYPMVREILKLKLILDRRRVPNIHAGKQKKEKDGKKAKEVNRSMFFTSLLYMFMGLFIASFQAMPHLFLSNIFSYGALIFILLTVYIGEYSAVLLDTTEKAFFGSLPVGQREIKIAKDIHIAYYIGVIAISTILPSVAFAIFFHGFFYGSLYFLVGMVIVVFCLRLAGSLYFLLLKLFSGEKLKDILNGFQVFVTIAIILGYQILPRMINLQDLSKVELEFTPFLFAVPSAWFASILSILFEAKTEWYYYGLMAVAAFAVLLLEFLYKNKIVKEFDRELEKLTEEVKENKSLSHFSRFLCKTLSKDRQEKAFMELVLIQISRDRNLKMKLYPQFVNVVILPVVILFSRIQDGGVGKLLEEMKLMPYYLALYMVGLSSAGIYTLIGQSENKESKLFYQILPIENLSKCIRAGVKIVIFKYLTPLFLFLSAFFVAVSGVKIIPDVIVIYVAFLFVTSLMIRLNAWILPFSTEMVAGNVGYKVFMFLMNFVLSGGIAYLHFMVFRTFPIKLLAFGILVGMNLVLWRFFMNKQYVIERE